ncbi:choline ABC transporter ATP-binding protein [Marinomonas agarivorans]|nr:choline ABC transporter ATP-binding protein [Marinomonas agarivorans]
MSVVSIKNLDVVFGDNQAETLELMDEGKNREQILGATGDVVGVQNANLDINEGEICVLMGLSGSGKSTLLRVVNGLNTAARGQCLVRNGDEMVDMTSCSEATLRHMRTHRVSMVFQSFALMPWLSVLDNVAFGLEMQGMSKADRQTKAMQQLEMVGLEQWAHKKPDELSGGMRQRVGLARAFAMDTDVLLMDEPFSALDPLIRSQLQDELIELQKKLNKTIIFVSHDLDEALKIGSKIAIMESANIVQQDIPEKIVLNPATKYVERFVAHTNPLNVLKGDSLMTPISALSQVSAEPQDKSSAYSLTNLTIQVDEKGQLQSATDNNGTVTITEYITGFDVNSLTTSDVVVAPADIAMRDAVEIRYQTKRPVLLQRAGRFVGILDDHDFYHALLGKHFSSTT